MLDHAKISSVSFLTYSKPSLTEISKQKINFVIGCVTSNYAVCVNFVNLIACNYAK